MGGERQDRLTVGRDTEQLAGVGVEQRRGAADQHLPQVGGVGRGGHLLGELGQAGEGIDAAPFAVIELGVLDGAGDQRGDVGEQIGRVLTELVRGAGVEHDHPDRLAGPRQDRHRGHRLKRLLLQQRDVLHARVLHRPVADELGRRWRATQPVRPSWTEKRTLPTASPKTGDAARMTSSESSSR